jgi:hypothetical protein
MAGEKVIRNPLASMLSNFFSWNRQFLKKRYTYPSSLATAWFDFSGITHGLSLDARDQSFVVQDLYIEKLVERHPEDKTLNTEALSFAWTFYPHIAPGETWTCPTVRIGVHAGDWHVVADRHRDWLETWIKKPQVPDWFTESIGWHFYFMKHEDGTVLRTYDDLQEMAQIALDHGIPNLMIFGWFEGGHDNLFPDFEAVEAWGGAAVLKEKLDALKAMGANPILYVNPTIWEVRTQAYARYGHQWSVKSRVGSEFRERWAWENFDATAEHRLKGFARICPSNGSTPFFLDVLKRIFNDYGGSSIHLDQIGDRAFCCYDPTHDHDHEKPQYASCQGYQQMPEALRPMIQQKNGVLLIQGASDFHNQWADASWEVEAPFLFTDVNILRYSLPWMTVSHEIEANEYADVNRCFAANVLLDIKINSSDGSLADFPKFGAHIKQVAALKKRAAPYHAHAVFRDTIGLEYDDQDGSLIARLHRAQGKAGIAIANLNPRATYRPHPL